MSSVMAELQRGSMDLLAEGWITLERTQELTGYSEKQLYRLVQSGKVEARKLGKMWLINREALLQHQATARPGRKARK